jgi:hypothetical protein
MSQEHALLASSCPGALISKGHHLLAKRIRRFVLAAGGVTTDETAKNRRAPR